MRLFAYPSEFQLIPENNQEVKRLQSLGAKLPFAAISLPRAPGASQVIRALGWDYPNILPQSRQDVADSRYMKMPPTPTQPRPWQIGSFLKVLTYPFHGIFMRMRLGKTWIAVTAMALD